MDSTTSFGYWVRRRRRALDLTQVALARMVGCAHVTIKKIEQDERRPSRQLAERLAGSLEVPAEERERFLKIACGERSADQLPLPSWPLSSSAPESGLPDALEGRHAPATGAGFVGRDHALARLNAHLRRSLDGHGEIVFVIGEAGYGKTALLDEFARRVQLTHGDLIVAHGTCNEHTGPGDPYLPFRDVLSLLTGDIAPQVAAGTITREHARRLWRLMPHTAEILVEDAPDLLNNFVAGAALAGRLARLADGAGWLARLEARTTEDRGESDRRPLIEQYTRMLRRLSTLQPLLLVLDDLQWADTASINLLFHLGRRLAGSRILIVAAYRPGDLTIGQREGGAEQAGQHPLQPVVDELTRSFGNLPIDLAQITPAEARCFVDEVLDREPNRLDEPFRAGLFRHADGHPLFTLELLRELRERGSLLKDPEGRWIAGQSLDWEALPARVEAVIRQRIGRLDNTLRELLVVASVEGETFTAQLVAAVLGLEEQQVLRRLSWELQGGHRLVREREEIDAGGRRLSRFQFSHVLVQHYLYHAISRGERRLLHGAVASTLEQFYRGRTDDIALQLARHYRDAGQEARAVDYLLRAGDQARTLYAHQEASDCYRWALAILNRQGDYERAARTLVKLGLTYQTAFDFELARQAYDEGFALWQQAGGIRPASSPAPAPHALRVDWRDPPTLDPTRAGNFWSAGVIGQLFSGLVELTPESDIVPDVAQMWEVLDGGRTYLFRLRDDVSWSDGTPVTAEDFVFAWTRALRGTRSSLAALLLEDIKGARAVREGGRSDPEQIGIQALAETLLLVELDEPVAYFPHLLAHPATFPVPRHAIAAHGDRWTEPGKIVTNGPFALTSWEPGETMMFTRNPDYRGRFTGNLQQLEVHLTTDPFKKLALYEANELDVFRAWFLPASSQERARHRHAEEYISGPQVTALYIGFDATRPPFADRRVRQAFVLATDRDMHANIVHRGHFAPATGGFVPPGMPGHMPGIGLPFHPDQARQLLAEAGYPGGRGFPCIDLLVSDFRAEESRRLVAQWRDLLGVEVRCDVIETAISAELLRATRPRMFFNGWAADYADPDSFLRVCVHATLPGWSDESYEHLVAAARQTTEHDRRIHLYQQADRILVEEAVLMPLTYPRVQLLVKPWVKRYPISAMKAWFWKDVVIEPHELSRQDVLADGSR